MATQIHTKKHLSEDELSELIKKQNSNEVTWYMSEVITSHADSIRDVLSYCMKNLEESDCTPYKLPLSSHNSEFLKGTITRTNFKVTELHMIINCPHFNNGRKFEFTLKPQSDVIIRQLLDCHDSLENAYFNLDRIIENGVQESDPVLFMKFFEQLCSHIQNARESLASPDSAYMFPQYRTKGTLFEPPLPSTGALDFSINGGELVIDFKSLTIIDKKPWSMIVDPDNRRSFADLVRQQISKKRNLPMNKIISDEYTKYLDWKKNNYNETSEENGLGSTIKNIFGTNSDPSLSTLIKNASNYLEQVITFVDDDNRPFVVQISHKCEVVTADPILLSISIKLESIEKTVLRIRDNIMNIYN